MAMPPQIRKIVLTAHVSSSVGWLGGIACFLALAVSGISTHDLPAVHVAYLGMNWIGWRVLVPLSFASLLSGIVQSLGTEWGLFRHYWVLFKLAINVLASTVLLLFMLELRSLVALNASERVTELMSPSPLIHASVGLMLVLMATVLSVYKPRGMTAYGWKKQQERALHRE